MIAFALLLPCSHACNILELNCQKAEGSYGDIGVDGLDVVVSLQAVRHLLHQLVDKPVVGPTTTSEISTSEQVTGPQESQGEVGLPQEQQVADPDPVMEKVGGGIDGIRLDTKAA